MVTNTLALLPTWFFPPLFSHQCHFVPLLQITTTLKHGERPGKAGVENVYQNEGDFMSERGYNDGFLRVWTSAGGRKEMEGSGFASNILSKT